MASVWKMCSYISNHLRIDTSFSSLLWNRRPPKWILGFSKELPSAVLPSRAADSNHQHCGCPLTICWQPAVSLSPQHRSVSRPWIKMKEDIFRPLESSHTINVFAGQTSIPMRNNVGHEWHLTHWLFLTSSVASRKCVAWSLASTIHSICHKLSH
jgi:hypothetical protein